MALFCVSVSIRFFSSWCGRTPQLTCGTLKGGIPVERQAKAEAIIALLHSHGLVKGYSGGNAVPVHAASHLRFLVGGDETMTMEE